MRKQILAVMLAAAIAGSMTACAGKGNTNQTEQTTEAKETVSDPLEILQAVWDKFPENDRFAAAGGDMTEENMVDNGPGRFGSENAAEGFHGTTSDGKQADAKENNRNQIDARDSCINKERHAHRADQRERRADAHTQNHLIRVLDVGNIGSQACYQSGRAELINVRK